MMRAALALPPNREIDFDCDCVACVRASERSCVSARESPSVARARRANLWGVVRVVRARTQKEFEQCEL
jgi:hypothetical protein